MGGVCRVGEEVRGEEGCVVFKVRYCVAGEFEEECGGKIFSTSPCITFVTSCSPD